MSSASTPPGGPARSDPDAPRRLEAAWLAAPRTGLLPRVEDYLAAAGQDEGLIRKLIARDAAARRRLDFALPLEVYRRWLADPLLTSLLSGAAPSETGDVTLTFPHDSTAEVAPGAPPPRLGRYEVRGVLGRGGFGIVYEGWDPQLCRRVALKVPRAGLLTNRAAVERFLDEARRVVQLEHPGIVAVYDVGVEQGQPFIVTQLVDGHTLADRLKKGPLPPTDTAVLVAALADLVHFAHRRGWVHRDVKPSNVLLDADGTPHLADFGIAAPLDEVRLFQGAAGTLPYMAPELVRQLPWVAQGEAAGPRADHRADIYSLGVVLYQCLTGTLPFLGPTRDATAQLILHSEPVPLQLHREGLPPGLEEVCLTALAKNPAARYRSAAELRTALCAAAGIATPATAAPARKRSPALLAGILVGGGLAFVAVLLVLARLLWPASEGPVVTTPPPGGTDAEIAKLRAEVRHLLGRLDAKQPATPPGRPGAEPIAPRPGKALPAAAGWPATLAEMKGQIAKARAAGDEESEFSLLLRATNELLRWGHADAARQAAERMVEIAGTTPNRAPLAYGQLGLAQARLGQYRQAAASYADALKTYRALYDRLAGLPVEAQPRGAISHLARLVGITLMRQGNAWKSLRSYAQAETAYTEARTLLERHDRKAELMTLLSNIGSLQSQQGKHREAVATLRQSADLARSLKEPDEEAEVLINLGNAQSRSGDDASALDSYRAAEKVMTPRASYEARSGLLVNWIGTLAGLGRAKEAQALAAQLRSIARPSDAAAQRVLRQFPAAPSDRDAPRGM